MGGDLFEFVDLSSQKQKFELISAFKLVDEQQQQKQRVALQNATDKFILTGHMFSLNRIETDAEIDGAYLLEFYSTQVDGAQQLIRIDLSIESAETQQTSLIWQRFNVAQQSLLVKSAISTSRNYYFDAVSHDQYDSSNKSSFLANLYDGATLLRFQSLLFGANGDSFLNNFKQMSQSSAIGHASGLSRILLSSRTSLVQFIIVTLVISLVLVIVFVCCIFVVVKKNCSNKKSSSAKHQKKTTKKSKSANNLNVTDDDIKNNSSELFSGGINDGGFTRIDVTHQEKDNTKEKVNRYLDGLDSLITSQHYQNAYIINQNQIELNENLNYLNEQAKKSNNAALLSSSSSSSTSSSSAQDQNAATTSSGVSASSPSSSSSLVDSKKSLIIPVNYLKNTIAHHTPPANTTTTTKINVTTAGPQHSSTLSTTSSSLMSDEGCYGSSDFSTERDANNAALLKLLKQQQLQSQQQQQVPVSYANSNTAAYQKQMSSIYGKHQQPNYCVSNLSRFENLYNNNTLTTKSNANHIPDDNHVQIITSISGSYV